MNQLVSILGDAVTIKPVGDGGNTLQQDITNIITGITVILGIVAVVVIIVGGIGYMTSSGDAAKVKKAKDTILYGVIGLIIVILSFAIVNFVLGATNSSSGGGSGSGGNNTEIVKPGQQDPTPPSDPTQNIPVSL